MKIEEKNLDFYKDLLSAPALFDIDNIDETTLFFPIEVPEQQIEKEEENIILLEKTQKAGANKLVKPGLIITKFVEEVSKKKKWHGNYIAKLAYVSTEYAIPFSLREYFSLTKEKSRDRKLRKKEEEAILLLDCFVVKASQIAIIFK